MQARNIAWRSCLLERPKGEVAVVDGAYLHEFALSQEARVQEPTSSALSMLRDSDHVDIVHLVRASHPTEAFSQHLVKIPHNSPTCLTVRELNTKSARTRQRQARYCKASAYCLYCGGNW